MGQFEADEAGSINAHLDGTESAEADFVSTTDPHQNNEAEVIVNDSLRTTVYQQDFSKKRRPREHSKVLISPENIEDRIKKQEGKVAKTKAQEDRKKEKENQKRQAQENATKTQK